MTSSSALNGICISLHLFLVINATSSCFAQRCFRKTANNQKSPTVLCYASITVQHTTPCSLRVSESLLLPHTNGKPEYRDFAGLGKRQSISAVRLLRNNEIQGIPSTATVGNKLRLELKTVNSSSPVLFQLSYTVSDIMKPYAESCNATSARPNLNILSWTAGWERKSIESFKFDSSGKTRALV